MALCDRQSHACRALDHQMHHPETRPVFEPLFILHRNNTTNIYVYKKKHELWPCLSRMTIIYIFCVNNILVVLFLFLHFFGWKLLGTWYTFGKLYGWKLYCRELCDWKLYCRELWVHGIPLGHYMVGNFLTGNLIAENFGHMVSLWDILWLETYWLETLLSGIFGS